MGRNHRFRQVVSATDMFYVVLLCLGTTGLCWVENGALSQLWHSCRGKETAKRCKKKEWAEEWNGTEPDLSVR